jgi:hypothetical protein
MRKTTLRGDRRHRQRDIVGLQALRRKKLTTLASGDFAAAWESFMPPVRRTDRHKRLADALHRHQHRVVKDFAATGGPFAEFMNWIETVVGQAQWSLAGHSGAGDVIAKSLNLNPSIIAKFDAIELLDAAYNIHHEAGRFRSGSEAALWQTIAERNPSLTLSCIGNGTYSGCQVLAEQVGFTTVALTETHVDHCEIPNTYFGSWLHRIGPVAEVVARLGWVPMTRGGSAC